MGFVLRVHRNVQGYPLLGEFKGVATQVYQHLQQAAAPPEGLVSGLR